MNLVLCFVYRPIPYEDSKLELMFLYPKSAIHMIERIYNILKHNDKRSSNSINTPTSEQSLACKDAEFVLLAIVFSTYVTLDICV